jgi:hypothetical protein
VTDAIDEIPTGAASGVLARWLLTTTDPSEIRARLARLVHDHLHTTVAAVEFCSLSVGAVFGLRLADGRAVVVKVLRPDTEPGRAAAARRVHAALHALGFPSPAPILPPVSFAPSAIALVDELVRGGAAADGHEPAVRATGAHELAQLVRLAAAVPDTQALTVPAPQVPEDLWPTPHNPLFDFRATARGAEWIDELARGARAAAEPVGDTVVVHTDWTVRNLRFVGSALHVAFDWDSVGRDLEVRTIGTAAAMFPAHGLHEGMSPPTPDESAAFVADYEAARGRPFSAAERRAIGAATLFCVAYTARCEHAVDGAGAHLTDSYRTMLGDHGRAYLDLR